MSKSDHSIYLLQRVLRVFLEERGQHLLLQLKVPPLPPEYGDVPPLLLVVPVAAGLAQRAPRVQLLVRRRQDLLRAQPEVVGLDVSVPDRCEAIVDVLVRNANNI